MASQQQVRQYLAYWFQLGKRVMLNNGHSAVSPQPVIRGDRYSAEFEACWQQLLLPESGVCYLEGTHQTIQELLSSAWDISGCARCDMPVPMLAVGLPSESCPCSDIPGWPNTELPAPRSPVIEADHLRRIRNRLLITSSYSGEAAASRDFAGTNTQ